MSSELDALLRPLEDAGGWVVGQLGQSLDGRIATGAGHSHYINGPEDIHRLHRVRALADAVVVGAGTVIADDPRLTVRLIAGNNPVRVVLDPQARVPASAGVFCDGQADTLHVVGPRAAAEDAPGVSVVRLVVGEHGFDPHEVLAALAERGLRRVLVEGGGITVSRFLEVGALDRLHVSVAPILIGSGRPSITLPEIATLDQALRPEVRHFHLAEDVVFDLRLEPTRREDSRPGRRARR